MQIQPAALSAVPVQLGHSAEASQGPRRSGASPDPASDSEPDPVTFEQAPNVDIPSVMRDAVLQVDGADDPRAALAEAFASALRARGLDVAEVAAAMRSAGPFALPAAQQEPEGPAAELLAALQPGSLVDVTA